MTFAEYLIKLAVDKYNKEYKKSFVPSEFSIRPITPNIRTNLGCEVYTKIENDFLRLRLYLVFSDITQLIPYKLEVDKSDNISDLNDEVHVTTGDIDFFYIKEKFINIHCNMSSDDPVDPIEEDLFSYLLKEQLGYILTEDNKKIMLNEINDLHQKDMFLIRYPRTNLNIVHQNLIDDSSFKGSISIDATGDRIFISNNEGYGITNTIIDIGNVKGGVTTYSLAEVAIVYKRSLENKWKKENKLRTISIGNYFGKDVTMNQFGDLVAISASKENIVHLFKRSGVTWYPLFDIVITKDLDEPIESFGLDMSLSNNNILLVNRPFKVIAGNANNAKGLINIYSLVNNVLTTEDDIILDINNNYGTFGHKIEISKSGNKIIATNNDNGQIGVTSNYIYVFSKILDVWTLEATITPLNSTLTDGCRDNISISDDGTRIAIGANKATISGTTNAGKVYIYKRNINGTWDIETTIDNPNTTNILQFGTNIKLSGNGENLFIGTRMKRMLINNGTRYRCYWFVYQYKLIDNVWTMYYEITDPKTYDTYLIELFNSDIHNETDIDSVYDGSLAAIGTKNICYVVEDLY